MSSYIDPIARKRALIEARKAAVAPAPKEDAIATRKALLKPEDATERIRIIFDNSGSMNSSIKSADGNFSSMLEEAKKGVIEFLRNCNPSKDAVAVHLLNAPYRYENSLTAIASLISNATLTTDLILLASSIDTREIRPTGGTPLFNTIYTALESEPKATRLVAFSDGEPNPSEKKGIVYSLAKRYKIPIDTVFFGSCPSRGADVMKEIASETGGIFIAFDPAKGVSFASAFKYLTSGKRLMLMNEEFKKKLESGEVK